MGECAMLDRDGGAVPLDFREQSRNGTAFPGDRSRCESQRCVSALNGTAGGAIPPARLDNKRTPLRRNSEGVRPPDLDRKGSDDERILSHPQGISDTGTAGRGMSRVRHASRQQFRPIRRVGVQHRGGVFPLLVLVVPQRTSGGRAVSPGTNAGRPSWNCPQASDADPQTEALRSSIGTPTMANLAEAGNFVPQRGVGGVHLAAAGPPDRQVCSPILVARTPPPRA